MQKYGSSCFAGNSFEHNLWNLTYYTLESPTYASWMPILGFLKVNLKPKYWICSPRNIWFKSRVQRTL